MRLGEVLEKILQGFVLKPKPKKFLKALRSNAFKNFFVVSLIGNYCKIAIRENLNIFNLYSLHS